MQFWMSESTNSMQTCCLALLGRLKATGPKAMMKAGINNRSIVRKIYYVWTELIAQ